MHLRSWAAGYVLRRIWNAGGWVGREEGLNGGENMDCWADWISPVSRLAETNYQIELGNLTIPQPDAGIGPDGTQRPGSTGIFVPPAR